jgi:hypothetical protein
VFGITRDVPEARPGGPKRLVVGRIEVRDQTLRVETNSAALSEARPPPRSQRVNCLG